MDMITDLSPLSKYLSRSIQLPPTYYMILKQKIRCNKTPLIFWKADSFAVFVDLYQWEVYLVLTYRYNLCFPGIYIQAVIWLGYLIYWGYSLLWTELRFNRPANATFHTLPWKTHNLIFVLKESLIWRIT